MAYDDIELIVLIGYKDDDPKEAEVAFTQLFDRFWKPMFLIAKRVCAFRRDPQSDAEDLVMDTFSKVFENASTFKSGRIKDSKKMRYAIIGWMTRIMKNVFFDNYLDEDEKDRWKKRQKHPDGDEPETDSTHILPVKKRLKKYVDDEQDEFVESLENDGDEEEKETSEDSEPGHNESVVDEQLRKMPERDADIVRTVYNYYVEGKNTPSDVLDDLESRWKTSRDNVRMIVKKFDDTLAQEIEKKLKFRI